MDQDDGVSWSVSPIGHYPYVIDDIEKLPSPPIDHYQRNKASLLTSIGSFAQKVSRSTLPDFSIEEIKQAGRVCTFVMTMDDYLHFFGQTFQEPTRTSTLILHLNLLQEDEIRYFNRLLPTLTEYDDIILSTVSSTGKVVLLRILPAESAIDTYCITPVQFDEMKELLKALLALLSQACGRRFSINLRLQVPVSFHPDPLFVALFITATLERFGKYLEANESTLLDYKLWMLRDFITLHDTYLGQLNLEDVSRYSHPFQTARLPGDKFRKLEKKGWFVMDVDGDGNCGYYALILGLQNVGNHEYFIDTSGDSPRVAKRRWQDQVLALRQRLEAGSNELLSEVFPVGSPNRALGYWMTVLGTFDTDEQNELSNSFLIPNNDNISLYFNKDFTEDPEMHHYHMNPYWAAIVIAYVFEVRVVIVTRTSSPKENATSKDDVEYSHGTKIFEFDNDFRTFIDTYVPVTEHDKSCYRISDASFHAKPTIELLFITGHKSLGGGSDDNHFLFLRRVLCVRVPSALPVSATPLLSLILETEQQSETATNEMEVDMDPPPDIQQQSQSSINEHMETEHEPPSDVTNPPHADTSTQNEGISTQGNFNSLTETITNPMEAEIEPPSEDMQIENHSTRRSTEETSNLSPPSQKDDEETSSTESYDNVMYDVTLQKFFTACFNNKLKRYLNKTLVEDTSIIDPQLLEDAKSQPNVWVSLPLGDACDATPPLNLITKVKCLYEQLERPYCVTYCMANALFYCGFHLKARDLAAQAPLLAPLNMAAQLEAIKSFIPNLVPLIGGATIYGKRCAGNKKRKRSITVADLFSDITPYPTLVVPSRQDNGRMTHAFCVVDDLIFDSCTSYALKLKMESINWIFNNVPVDIFVALRFNKKVSPEGHKVRGKYKRLVQRNWIHDSEPPSMIEHDDTACSKPIVTKVYDVEIAAMPKST